MEDQLLQQMDEDTEQLLSEAVSLLKEGEADRALELFEEFESHQLPDWCFSGVEKSCVPAPKGPIGLSDPDFGEGLQPPAVRAADTSDVRFAYCLLLMSTEKEVTLATVSNLLRQIDADDRVFVLFNGFEDHELKARLENHSGVMCISSTYHLGVAGGRNVLYSHVIAHDDSITHIVTIDNDVLLPNDLNGIAKGEVSSKYERLNVGVLGGVILDLKKGVNRKFIDDKVFGFKSYLNADCHNIHSEDLREHLRNHRSKPGRVLWHMGMHPDYRKVYVERHRESEMRPGPFEGFLAITEEASKLLSRPFFKVSNIPGCFQIISVAYLKEAGFLDERFSPYFFEDSEFCIRAIRAGKQNIISTELMLLHGTDFRHLERKQTGSKQLHVMNEYRARYILMRVLEERDVVHELTSMARWARGRLPDDEERESIYAAMLEGIEKGAAQFHDHEASDDFESIRRTRASEGHTMPTLVAHPGSLSIGNASAATFSSSLSEPGYSLSGEYFSRMKAFRNAYQGQDCLIVCNGPSLAKTRLGLFAGMPTFAENCVFPLQSTVGFTPTFYTVEDARTVDENLAEIRKLRAGYKFFPENCRPMIGDSENQFYLPVDWSCCQEHNVSFGNPEFSEDLTRRIFAGQTVTYLNLQLAYFFGFSRVFIVGLDFSHTIPRDAGSDLDPIIRRPDRYHPSGLGRDRQSQPATPDSCLTSYSRARLQFERDGRQVLDLTLGGKLNVFDKSKVGDVFGFADEAPVVADGLEPRQFIIDSCHAIAHRMGLSCSFSEEGTEDRDALTILDFQNHGQVAYHLVAMWRRSLGKRSSVLFRDEGLQVLAGDLGLLNKLPRCEWIDSSLHFRNLYINDWDPGMMIPPEGLIVFEHSSRFESNVTRNILMVKMASGILISEGNIYYHFVAG